MLVIKHIFAIYLRVLPDADEFHIWNTDVNPLMHNRADNRNSKLLQSRDNNLIRFNIFVN